MSSMLSLFATFFSEMRNKNPSYSSFAKGLEPIAVKFLHADPRKSTDPETSLTPADKQRKTKRNQRQQQKFWDPGPI